MSCQGQGGVEQSGHMEDSTLCCRGYRQLKLSLMPGGGRCSTCKCCCRLPAASCLCKANPALCAARLHIACPVHGCMTAADLQCQWLGQPVDVLPQGVCLSPPKVCERRVFIHDAHVVPSLAVADEVHRLQGHAEQEHPAGEFGPLQCRHMTPSAQQNMHCAHLLKAPAWAHIHPREGTNMQL